MLLQQFLGSHLMSSSVDTAACYAQPPAPSTWSLGDPGCLPARSVCPGHVAVPLRSLAPGPGWRSWAARHPRRPHSASFPGTPGHECSQRSDPGPWHEKAEPGGPFPCQGSSALPHVPARPPSAQLPRGAVFFVPLRWAGFPGRLLPRSLAEALQFQPVSTRREK